MDSRGKEVTKNVFQDSGWQSWVDSTIYRVSDHGKKLDLDGAIVSLEGMTMLLLSLHISGYQGKEWWSL